jgi:hypothetical protein
MRVYSREDATEILWGVYIFKMSIWGKMIGYCAPVIVESIYTLYIVSEIYKQSLVIT